MCVFLWWAFLTQIKYEKKNSVLKKNIWKIRFNENNWIISLATNLISKKIFFSANLTRKENF